MALLRSKSKDDMIVSTAKAEQIMRDAFKNNKSEKKKEVMSFMAMMMGDDFSRTSTIDSVTLTPSIRMFNFKSMMASLLFVI